LEWFSRTAPGCSNAVYQHYATDCRASWSWLAQSPGIRCSCMTRLTSRLATTQKANAVQAHERGDMRCDANRRESLGCRQPPWLLRCAVGVGRGDVAVGRKSARICCHQALFSLEIAMQRSTVGHWSPIQVQPALPSLYIAYRQNQVDEPALVRRGAHNRGQTSASDAMVRIASVFSLSPLGSRAHMVSVMWSADGSEGEAKRRAPILRSLQDCEAPMAASPRRHSSRMLTPFGSQGWPSHLVHG
jgi:hypothetical protein